MYYSRLLFEFLKCAKKFDIYASVRPCTSIQSINQKLKPLEIILKVLNVFSDSKLLKHLQIIESALDSLESYSGGARSDSRQPLVIGSIVTPSKTCFRNTSIGTPVAGTFVDPGYSNCGPLIRAQVIFFEGKCEYVPVFLSVVDSTITDTVHDLVNFSEFNYRRKDSI